MDQFVLHSNENDTCSVGTQSMRMHRRMNEVLMNFALIKPGYWRRAECAITELMTVSQANAGA